MNSVSVIMATNKADSYLDEAIASVFANQDVEIELVLVLDGIQLPQPLPAWSSDPRVTIVPLAAPSGLPTGLNAGITAAKYDVIARLDADDNASPTRFRQQLDALFGDDSPALVGSRTVLIDEHGRVLGEPQQSYGSDIRRDLLLQNVVPHSTYMLRKADAFAVGLYNPELRQMEDYDFLLRIATLGPISMLSDRLVQYRIHSGQMSKKATWRAPYISTISRRRRELGTFLGVPASEVHLKNFVWRAVQVARSTGLLKPRHLIGVQTESKSESTHRQPIE